MTFTLPKINSYEMHLMTGETERGQPPRGLCADAGEPLKSNAMHLWTTAPDRVTCRSCIEWMHA